jgi:hypothetical protein
MLDVSGGLIEDESLIDPLLYDEKATVALGDGGNGDFGLAGEHAANYSHGRVFSSRRAAPLLFAGRPWRSRQDVGRSP